MYLVWSLLTSTQASGYNDRGDVYIDDEERLSDSKIPKKASYIIVHMEFLLAQL
jgi:hypothetical protein